MMKHFGEGFKQIITKKKISNINVWCFCLDEDEDCLLLIYLIIRQEPPLLMVKSLILYTWWTPIIIFFNAIYQPVSLKKYLINIKSSSFSFYIVFIPIYTDVYRVLYICI